MFASKFLEKKNSKSEPKKEVEITGNKDAFSRLSFICALFIAFLVFFLLRGGVGGGLTKCTIILSKAINRLEKNEKELFCKGQPLAQTND